MEITLDQAERLVAARRDMFWDGWTFVHVTPYPAGWARKDGLFRDGKWHIAKRYQLTDQGTYKVTRTLGRGL